MMVTFISQCEKKALNRTRRVLDSFASRIGDNTWQTVITNEGLNAVKKLLRKTATKNTAVSCHWIRSRSRSELVWVVGNKGKFDEQGVVPVNRTEKEIPMDISNNKPVKGCVYANTQLQQLEQHLFSVGFVARQLYLRFYPDKSVQANAAFIAGCLHDIGKIDPSFQDWVVKDKNKSYIAEDGQHTDGPKKFSFENYPRHNEISVLLYCIIKLIPHEYVEGKENGKQVKDGFRWDSQADAGGKEKQLDELKSRWYRYTQQRWLELSKEFTQAPSSVYIENINRNGELNRNFIFNNENALKQIRWKHFIADCEPLITEFSNVTERAEQEVAKAEAYLQEAHKDIMKNFDPKVVKLKKKMEVVVAPGAFDGLVEGGSGDE